MRHNVILALIFATLFPPGLTSCGRQSTSDVKITNGRATSDFPEVVMITAGGSVCTGTFVGHDTLITAAHCVKAGASTGVTYANSRSLRILSNPNYTTGVGPSDLAVVVFPPNTAPATATLSPFAPNAGDVLTIVGYGDNDAVSERGWGQKRVGTNTVLGAAGGIIQVVGATGPGVGDGRNSASGSGDSGGPLFIAGRLSGVTSGGNVSGDEKHSDYVDLSSAESRGFLRSAVYVGATIPGI